jgi:hypothetical protein
LTINDYAKLWLDGKLLFDGWAGSYSNLCHTFDLDLVEGQRVDIRVEYANTTGDGFARLEWESEAFQREVIPQNQFYSDVDTSTYVAVPRLEADPGEIRIYPNPASDQLCISCPEATICEVYNLTGRKLDAFIINSDLVERDSSTWPSGMYLLKFRSKNSSSFRKVLIKQTG